MAECVNNIEKISVSLLLSKGFNTNTLFELINEHFLYIEDEGSGEELLYEGENLLNIFHGNKFKMLKWYGYYDAE